MKMLLDQQLERLRANGQYNESRRTRGETEIDFMPVVKLFTPWAGATWLLTELDPEDPDIAFGLCDLGLGFPELGNVSLSELEALQGPLGLRVERDLHFKAAKTLGQYAEEARHAERIIA
jgi:hypothetical protein